MNKSKILNMGFGELDELEYLCNMFSISRKTAGCYLKALRIKPMCIGKGIYFSLPTLKRILFVLSLPGSPGFLFPGSARKAAGRDKDKVGLTLVTDEILEKAASPRILAEMNAVEGRDISLLKKFITPSAGRPKKEVEDGK